MIEVTNGIRLMNSWIKQLKLGKMKKEKKKIEYSN